MLITTTAHRTQVTAPLRCRWLEALGQLTQTVPPGAGKHSAPELVPSSPAALR